MRKFAAALATILMLYVGIRYSYLILNGNIHPNLTTWILFSVATTISFWAYWLSGQRKILSNIGNLVDLVCCWGTLLTIIIFEKESNFTFNQFEVICLTFSGVFMIIWGISKWHTFSYLALQLVMCVAYLPTINKLWKVGNNSESFETWSILWLACVIAYVPAIIDRDKLALVYVTRAIFFISIILVLMLRFHVS